MNDKTRLCLIMLTYLKFCHLLDKPESVQVENCQDHHLLAKYEEKKYSYRKTKVMLIFVFSFLIGNSRLIHFKYDDFFNDCRSDQSSSNYTLNT